MTRNAKFPKLLCFFLALLLIGAMLVSCGGDSAVTGGGGTTNGPVSAGLDASAAGQQGKIVITMTVRAYTDNFTEDFNILKTKLLSVGGYIASSTSNYSATSGNTVTATLKVPADKCQEFTDSFSGYLEIRSSEVKSEDITEQYIDAESRIKALETERDALQRMMQDNTDYGDVMTISSRLTAVIADLEKAKALLAEYEKRVAFSTIHLTLTEKTEENTGEEPSMFVRMGRDFVDSLGSVGNFFADLLVFFIGKLPQLVLWAGVITLIVVLVKKKKKRDEKRNAYYKKNPPYAPYAPKTADAPKTESDTSKTE